MVAEKCKQCEIYRRIYDMYGERFSQKSNVYKWAMGLPLWAWIKRIVHGVETYFGKEKNFECSG